MCRFVVDVYGMLFFFGTICFRYWRCSKCSLNHRVASPFTKSVTWSLIRCPFRFWGGDLRTINIPYRCFAPSQDASESHDGLEWYPLRIFFSFSSSSWWWLASWEWVISKRYQDLVIFRGNAQHRIMNKQKWRSLTGERWQKSLLMFILDICLWYNLYIYIHIYIMI